MAAVRGGLRRHLPAPLFVRDFALFSVANIASNFAMNMAQVTIGYQVYAISHSKLDLGLIGLAAFVPLALLALPAGQLADRFRRTRIYMLSNVIDAAVMAGLVAVSLAGAKQVWPFLALSAATGVASIVGAPAGRAMSPMLVPEDLVESAMALRSTTFQLAVVSGPALGGIVLSLDNSGVAVYVIAVVLCLGAAVAATQIAEPVAAFVASPAARGRDALLEGLRFVRRTQVLLGAIALDLFAVLFGGAVSLLPAFQKDILHTGPASLGFLRAAPAVGAVVAGAWLAKRPLRRHEGRTLLIAVAGFGASMIVFGLSRSLALSLVCLALSGFADMYSMAIRGVTVAVATPDELRGRVNAVEMVFISGSNELGGFESGVAAWAIGLVPAVVIGGIATVGLAALWRPLFPALAKVDGLASLRPARLR